MPTSPILLRLTGAATALCVSAAVAAPPLPLYGVFVYSDFCVSPQSGDLYGDRITLLRSADGTTLVFEYTDGSTHGVVATDLKLDALRDTVSFNVQPEGAPLSAVAGKFAPDGNSVTLRGTPFAGAGPQTLARVTNFAAPAKDCKPMPGVR